MMINKIAQELKQKGMTLEVAKEYNEKYIAYVSDISGYSVKVEIPKTLQADRIENYAKEIGALLIMRKICGIRSDR